MAHSRQITRDCRFKIQWAHLVAFKQRATHNMLMGQAQTLKLQNQEKWDYYLWPIRPTSSLNHQLMITSFRIKRCRCLGCLMCCTLIQASLTSYMNCWAVVFSGNYWIWNFEFQLNWVQQRKTAKIILGNIKSILVAFSAPFPTLRTRLPCKNHNIMNMEKQEEEKHTASDSPSVDEPPSPHPHREHNSLPPPESSPADSPLSYRTSNGFSPKEYKTPPTPPTDMPATSPSPVVVVNRSVRDEPRMVTKVDLGAVDGIASIGVEERGGASARRGKLSLSILRRPKRERAVERAALGFRVCGFLFCLVSFSIMASDKNQGWTLDSFDRYKEFRCVSPFFYIQLFGRCGCFHHTKWCILTMKINARVICRYCLAVNVIGFVYSGLQGCDLAFHLRTGQHALRHHLRYHLDFFMDQASCLLIWPHYQPYLNILIILIPTTVHRLMLGLGYNPLYLGLLTCCFHGIMTMWPTAFDARLASGPWLGWDPFGIVVFKWLNYSGLWVVGLLLPTFSFPFPRTWRGQHVFTFCRRQMYFFCRYRKSLYNITLFNNPNFTKT